MRHLPRRDGRPPDPQQLRQCQGSVGCGARVGLQAHDGLAVAGVIEQDEIRPDGARLIDQVSVGFLRLKLRDPESGRNEIGNILPSTAPVVNQKNEGGRTICRHDDVPSFATA